MEGYGRFQLRVERLNKEYEELRLKNSTKQVKTVSLEEAQKNKLNLWS